MSTLAGNNNILIGTTIAPDANASNQLVIGTAAETTYMGGAPTTGISISAAGVTIVSGGKLSVNSSILDNSSITTRNISTTTNLTAQVVTASTAASAGSITTTTAKVDTITTDTLSATSINCNAATSPTSTVGTITATGGITTASLNTITLNAGTINTNTISADTITATIINDTLPYTSVNLSLYYNQGYYDLRTVCARSGTYFLQNATETGIVQLPNPNGKQGFRINIMLAVPQADPPNVSYIISGTGQAVFVPRPYWSAQYGTQPPISQLIQKRNMYTPYTTLTTPSVTYEGTSSILQNCFRLISTGTYWYEL
jgi:hypothetical protein